MEGAILTLNQLLLRASRTFALTTPRLPPTLREAVTIGYLLFRNADTIEDACQWSKTERLRELENFIAVVSQPANLPRAKEFAVFYESDRAGIKDLGHLEVLRQTPFIMEQLNNLPPEYARMITEHVARTAKGMRQWIESYDDDNQISLRLISQLDAYCYTAAGIVGEMLTQLFFLYSPAILPEKLPHLLTLGNGLAAGLQLTNIIKDCHQDHLEGRHYIPKEYFPFDPENIDKIIPVFAYALQQLNLGLDYVMNLPEQERGIRRFCLTPLALAVATLVQLHNHRQELFSGDDVKISQSAAIKLVAQVDKVIADNRKVQDWWIKLTGPLESISQKVALPKKSVSLAKANP